ncbi:MAG: phospho-sugar mutase [Myxococcota bacterium]
MGDDGGGDEALEAAIAGFAGVAVPAPVREAAAAALRQWWTSPSHAAYRPAIRALIDAGHLEELVDAFRQVLPFGTGGRRGAVGVGPNRMNPATVASSVQGHVDWLRSIGRERPAVVVAYDVRRFVDTKGLYGGVDSPIRGLSSRDLAELAARVYVANGVIVHLLPREATRYLSTPELSFTIRELATDGGINVSASHNPPDDNGVKVYDARGGQLVPPDDQTLLDVVAKVTEAKLVPWEEAVASGRLRWLDEAMHQRYVRAVASVVPGGPRELAPPGVPGILYTPLHGTGVVHEVLAAAGFEVALHGPQAAPDGAFPTVPNGVANPENPAAMADALAAAAEGTALVVGTDPDADRLGCEVRHRGRWVHLTGNDIASLVVVAALAECPTDPRDPLVIVTEVTSSLVGRVARSAGARVVDDLLVGFKYIAQGLAALEEDGAWHGIDAEDVRFVAGAEESHGVLVTSRIRDKDAAGGAVLLAALAAAERQRSGRTLVDLLHEQQALHGYVLNDQVSVAYPGATGQEKLAALLDGLRADPPSVIGGRPVQTAVDHRDESGPRGPFLSASDAAARNVLAYRLGGGPSDDGARVILRPSGTEPKLKAYVEVLGRPHLDAAGRAAVDAALEELSGAVRGWLA